jgi:hypothetical protein
MALVKLGGMGQQIWYPGQFALPPGSTQSTAIAATGDKFAMCGRVCIPGGGTKNLQRFGFRFAAAITKAGGSALTGSIQGVLTNTGPPITPDESIVQSVAISNGSIAANTWIRTGTFTIISVTHGDRIAVVIEYDGAGRLGADSMTFTTNAMAASTSGWQGSNVVHKLSGTWTIENTEAPNMVLEFDDGTFGTLMGCVPISTINTHTYKQDTASNDEFALAFQPAVPMAVDGFFFPFIPVANTSDFSFILYDGTTPMTGGTLTVDANAVAAIAVRNGMFPFTQEISLTAGHQYYLSAQPTQTTSNITVYSFDVADAKQLICHPGGQNFNFTTRVDSGAWAAITTTRRLFAGLHISSLDDGSGSGGGVMAPAMIWGPESVRLGV